jgi:NAD(P)-dependent dehydrogenase (short-subunit alcohol dehydrogenase family)
LGAHFAAVLARAGADVALAARRKDECQRHADEIIAAGGRALAVEMDVGDAASVHAAVAEATDRLGGLDVLVNNAGIAATSALIEMTEAEWDRILDVNLKGAFLTAQAAAKIMKTHGGAIINVASILGLRIAGQVAAYAASKAGLVQLTRSMALEWARFSIRANALCPGYVLTDINRDFFATDAGAAIVKRIPMRTLATLADLDGPLLLLASDAGRYITGAALPVDGGHLVSSL